MELYICVIVVLSIVVGIPTCIKSMEFILMYKFCRYLDEDEGAYVGGTTICEALTRLFSGKKEEKGISGGKEEVIISNNDANADEYADYEAAIAAASSVQAKPVKP